MIFTVLWVLVILHILWVWLRALQLGLCDHRRPVREVKSTLKPFVSVLVPAWNERTVLKSSLEALRESTYSTWEAIIIAGGDDGTEDFAHSLCGKWEKFIVIPQPPRGKNAALNQGLLQAKGNVIVILDADTQVEPDWLEKIIEPLSGDFEASSGDYFPLNRTWVSVSYEMEKLSAYVVHQENHLRGCGFAIKREVLERLGGFPEDVFVGVDWDLDQRLQRLGTRRTFTEEARSRTALPHTLSQFWHNQIRWRRAHLQIVFKFHKTTPLFFYGVALMFFLIPLLAAGLDRFLPGAWQIWPLFWLWVLLRRLSISLEVALGCGFEWLRWSWVPLVLLPIDFAAGLVALLTLHRKIIFFKGPRQHARIMTPSINEFDNMGAYHALDLIGMWIQHSGARRVRIITTDEKMNDRILLRLPYGAEIDQASDMDVFPFSLETESPIFTARYLAGCFHNRYSYRRLFHPHMPHRDLAWLKAELKRCGYRLVDWRGIYPPGFIIWWTLSILAGTNMPVLHFRLYEKAFQNLAKRSIFTHILAFYATRIE